MTRTTLRMTLLSAAALLPLAACQQTNQAATAAQSAAQAQIAPTLSTTDATFLNSAAMAGMGEVQLGQLASTKASSPAVRTFARRMVTDHTKVNDQLMQLAQSKQLTPNTGLMPNDQDMLTQLQGLRGRAFDRAYINGQVMDHQNTIQVFQ
ncbi:MAG: DUF4142 domain-containing protein, partial [Acetobacteraceae bacterium]|nr:DUF4142 domain-containing protein [Acetobacteraceae bacterium]